MEKNEKSISLNLNTLALLVIAVSACIYLMFLLKPVLVPLVVALFLVTLFYPVVDFLEKYLRLHWFFGFVLTLLLITSVLWLIGILIRISIIDLSANYTIYQETLSNIFTRISTSYEFIPEINLETLSSISYKQISNLGSLFSNGFLVLLYMFFFIWERPKGGHSKNGLVHKVNKQTYKYIYLKTLISIGTAIPFTLVLLAFDVPLAMVFGTLAFFLNFIPNIGPVVASFLPIPVLLMNPEMSLASGLLVFTLISSIQFISGNIVEMKILGDSFKIHPAILIFALVFWGFLWGIPGLFLAPVIIFAIKVTLEHYGFEWRKFTIKLN